MLKILILFCLSFELWGDYTDPTLKPLYGEDQRTQILDTQSDIYQKIGQIGNYCTGHMISERHVLTAASCVYNTDANEWLTGIYYRPGRNGALIPYGHQDWKKIYAHKNYLENRNKDWNFAVIELKDPVGRRTGYFQLPSSESYSGPIEVTGYPTDKPFSTMWKSDCFANTHNQRLVYKCDTAKGMSGAPLLNDNYNGLITYGVHSQDDWLENSGVYLNSLKRYFIRRWLSGGIPDRTSTFENPSPVIRVEFDTLFLKNNCGDDLKFQVRFTNTDGNGEIQDKVLLKDEEDFMIKTIRSDYYIKLESSENWINQKITTVNWGTVHHQLPCPF